MFFIGEDKHVFKKNEKGMVSVINLIVILGLSITLDQF